MPSNVLNVCMSSRHANTLEGCEAGLSCIYSLTCSLSLCGESLSADDEYETS